MSLDFSVDYSNQRAVPNFQEYFDRWKSCGDQLRAQRPCFLDVPYGCGWRQSIDIFPTSIGEAAPVVVFIHGGWWFFLDKKDYAFATKAYLDKGCVVASVGYPLAPAASLTEIVESVRRSLLWVYANIARFGGDPQRIHVAGHSAGGHLTAMMITTDWSTYGAPQDLIKSACSISGLFDLEDVLHIPQNENIRLLPDVAHRNSPIRLALRTAPPLVLCVGGAETKGFLHQHNAFMNAWPSAERPTINASLPGENHFSVIERLAIAESPLFKAAMRFICD